MPVTTKLKVADPAAANRAYAGCTNVMKMLSTALPAATPVQAQVLGALRQYLQETQALIDMGHCPGAIESVDAALSLLDSDGVKAGIPPAVRSGLTRVIRDEVRPGLVLFDVEKKIPQSWEHAKLGHGLYGDITVSRKDDKVTLVMSNGITCEMKRLDGATGTKACKDDCGERTVEVFDKEPERFGQTVKDANKDQVEKGTELPKDTVAFPYQKAILVTDCPDFYERQVTKQTITLNTTVNTHQSHDWERDHDLPMAHVPGIKDDKSAGLTIDTPGPAFRPTDPKPKKGRNKYEWSFAAYTGLYCPPCAKPFAVVEWSFTLEFTLNVADDGSMIATLDSVTHDSKTWCSGEGNYDAAVKLLDK